MSLNDTKIDQKDITFISVGSHCATSFYLKETGLKILSYPFDWCSIPFRHAVKYIHELCENNNSDIYSFTEKFLNDSEVQHPHISNIPTLSRRLTRLKDLILDKNKFIVFIQVNRWPDEFNLSCISQFTKLINGYHGDRFKLLCINTVPQISDINHGEFVHLLFIPIKADNCWAEDYIKFRPELKTVIDAWRKDNIEK
jgi:hypothetical protein